MIQSDWVEQTDKMPLTSSAENQKSTNCTSNVIFSVHKLDKVKVNNLQEMAQSERKSHSKNLGGKTKQTAMYL